MSRGPGWIQRALYLTILHGHKPMTFANIRDHIAKARDYPPGVTMLPDFQRSVRRALKRMVDDQAIIALGKGGPADPHRYCPNPMLVAMACDAQTYERVVAMINADPAAAQGWNKAASDIDAHRAHRHSDWFARRKFQRAK